MLRNILARLGLGGRDKRRHRRIETRVTVRFARSEETHTVTNLSLGGFAVNWPEPVPDMAPGSMLPKIEAVCAFVKATGNEGLITDPPHLSAALEGRSGTRIVP